MCTRRLRDGSLSMLLRKCKGFLRLGEVVLCWACAKIGCARRNHFRVETFFGKIKHFTLVSRARSRGRGSVDVLTGHTRGNGDEGTLKRAKITERFET